MTTIEMFGELEKKVADAAAKLKILNEAEAATSKANTDYILATAQVEKLQTELTAKISDLLPNPRVRKA